MTGEEERPPRWAYSRGAELLMRVATSAMAGVVVSLGWIAAGPASDETTALCVIIGLSAIMAVTIFWGVGRTEANKTRALLLAESERTRAAVDLKLEMQTQALRAELRDPESPGEAARAAVEEAIESMRKELHEEIAALVINGMRESGNVHPIQRRPPA